MLLSTVVRYRIPHMSVAHENSKHMQVYHTQVLLKAPE